MCRSATHPLQQLYHDPIISETRLLGNGSYEHLRAAAPVIFAAHAAVKTALEHARNDKVLGSSLQCSVILQMPAASGALSLLQEHASDLESMFVVSSVSVDDGSMLVVDEMPAAWRYKSTFEVEAGASAIAWVLPPQQAKCPRCWRYVSEEEDHLCTRCADVVAHE